MGKNSKLRCLFGLSRNRSSAAPMNQKLPLTKLPEKCPVKPNQYIHDGKERINDSELKLKSEVTDPDEKPEEILPLKIKEERHRPSREHSNAEVMMPTDELQELPLDPAEQNCKIPSRSGFNCVEDMEVNIPNRRPDSSISATTNTNNSSLVPSHSYERLVPFSSSPSFGKVSLSGGKKVCKIPPKKSRGFYQNQNNHTHGITRPYPQNDECSSSSTSSLFSSTLEAANFRQNPFQLHTTAISANASGSHDNFRIQHRQSVRDCDFGWVSDDLKNSENKRGQSNSDHCNCNHHNTMGQRYVNGYPEAYGPNHFLGHEVAFTVKESNGNCLQFTVAESGIHIQFPKDHVQNRFGCDISNSSHHQRHFEVMQQRGHQTHWPSSSYEIRHDTHHHSNHCTMTPSLTSQADTESMQNLHHSTRKSMKNEDFAVCNGAGATSGRKPHFELSMASYSKLMAYCDTNRLVRGSQSTSRRYPQPKPHCNLPLPYPSSSPTHVNDLCRLAKVLETVEECPWYWGALSGQEAKKVLRDSEPGTFLLRDSSDPRHLFSLSVKTRQGPTSIRIVYTDGTFRFDSEMDDVNARRQQGRNGTNNVPQSRSDHPNYVKKITPIFTCVVKMVLHYTKHLNLGSPKPRTQTAAKREHCPKCSGKLSDDVPTPLEADNPPPNPTSEDSYRPEQFMCYWVNRSGRQEIPVLLSTPMSRKQSFPSLQRLCRQSLNVSLKLWAREDIVDQCPLPNQLKKYLKKYPYPV